MQSVSELFPIIEDYTEFIIMKELGALKAPVDIEKIIKNYGIQVFRDKMNDNQSGAIVINEKSSGIVINEAEPSNRQRFTLAHELGHFISYKLQNKTGEIIEFRDGTSSLGINTEEIFANKFAAAILMPKKLLLNLFSMIENHSIEEFAKLLCVSKQALKIRIENL